MSSVANLSVSREAVPLPIATNSTLYCFASRPSVANASSHFFAGACG